MSDRRGSPQIIDVERLVNELKERVARERAAGAYGDDLSGSSSRCPRRWDDGLAQGFDLDGRRPARPLPAGARLLVETGRRPGDHARQEVLPAAHLLRAWTTWRDRPIPRSPGSRSRSRRRSAARESSRDGGYKLRHSSDAEIAAREAFRRDVSELSERADGIADAARDAFSSSRGSRASSADGALPARAGRHPHRAAKRRHRSAVDLRLRDLRGALPPRGVGARAPAAVRRAAARQEARRRPRLRARRADRDAEGRGRRGLRRRDRPRLRLAARGEGHRGRGQGRRCASLGAGARLGRRRRRLAPRRAPARRPP